MRKHPRNGKTLNDIYMHMKSRRIKTDQITEKQQLALASILDLYGYVTDEDIDMTLYPQGQFSNQGGVSCVRINNIGDDIPLQFPNSREDQIIYAARQRSGKN